MDSEQPEERSGGVLVGIIKRTVPWIALIVVLAVTWRYLGDYRTAVDAGKSKETSGTVETSGTAVTEGTYVRILNDGLNLRTEPSTNATVVRQLAKDQQLPLVDTRSGWYQVRDADGTVGWVAAGGSYTVLVEP